MATGPQKYPGASLAHWYQDRWGGDVMEVNVVVLHTTEGPTLPTYNGGAEAPNLTAVPDFAARKLRWYQHFDIDRSSRALVNLTGGVETNTLNVCQVELVGTCDPHTHAAWGGVEHIYWPEAPDWALAELAVFLRWMHAEHGVPLSGPKAWPAYPSSYGATSARMTAAEWTAFKGICGHLHVVENVHGDPGAIDFGRIIALAKGTTAPPEEDDMPTAAEVAKAVLTLDGVIAVPGAPTTNPTWTLSSVQTEILKRIDAVRTAEAAQTAAITSLARLVGTGVDTAAVVAAVKVAIAEAVVKVSVDVTGPATKEA